MRLIKMLALTCVMLGSIIAQEKDYVQPTKDNVGVFKNATRQLSERPVFTVGTQDRLLILDRNSRHYKVQNPDGKVGWIEKRMVVAVGRSKTFVFDKADVIGYLDNPTPVYIIDTDDPNADPINLDRSFKDALRENVDKETVERQAK
jgi:hypothetical protein